ncbi:MauE/DoxX family redox-associated membrane protein [Pedobacter sp. ASV1-7]|uniref:MauE/DoxX family redox-associated membrane protein n=1 Tax=Pedobacter sp. ASV1-7 TaxID=3145237 RepID=UPI0032E90E2D
MDNIINNRFSFSKLRASINQDVIVFVISRMLFLLFLYSAADKLYDIEKFRIQLGQSPLLTNLAGFVAWFIPAIEIIISILLIIPKTKLLGLFASFNLMVMFTAYIFVIMNYSEYIPCSCNGILEGATWGQHLAFNIAFVALALVGIVLQSRLKMHKPAIDE